MSTAWVLRNYQLIIMRTYWFIEYAVSFRTQIGNRSVIQNATFVQQTIIKTITNSFIFVFCSGWNRFRKLFYYWCYSGVRNGYRKRLKGQGDAPPNVIPSDIYLVAEQKPHQRYLRSGSDLIICLELSLGKLSLGC